jgi:HD-like signal output (HDOD) protein
MSSTAVSPHQISAVMQERLQKSVGKLQVLSAVAQEALVAGRDPNCTIQQFSSLVERDIKLAADLLTIANSAAFSAGRPVTNLREAVVRLGFRQCRNLILSSSLASLMKKLSIQEEWVRVALGRHAYITANLATQANRLLSLGLQGEEFVAGLIHDIGRNLLSVLDAVQFARADSLSFVENKSTPESESEIWGTNHCEAGAWFASHNDLPTEFAEVIRYHHAPQEATSHRRLIALIAICDDMSNHLQRGESPLNYKLACPEALEILAEEGATTAPVLLQQGAEQMMLDSLTAVDQTAIV